MLPTRRSRLATRTRIGPAAAGVTAASSRSGAPATCVPTSFTSSRGRIRTVTSFDVAVSQATWKGPGLASSTGILKKPLSRTRA